MIVGSNEGLTEAVLVERIDGVRVKIVTDVLDGYTDRVTVEGFIKGVFDKAIDEGITDGVFKGAIVEGVT